MTTKRARSKGELSIVPIYIPSGSARESLGVLPASALVGEWRSEAGRIMLDMEGNKYDAENLRWYVQRCHNAWDRHVHQYPTVARIWVMPHEVTIIGSYDPQAQVVTVSPLDTGQLAAWLGYRRGALLPQELDMALAQEAGDA